MYKRIKLYSFFLVFFIACSDNASSPQALQELSSSDEVLITDFSSSSINYEESSSSEKFIESSGSNGAEPVEVSSCSAKGESSSSTTVEQFSSSVKVEQSSSSEKVQELSSSSEIQESSSSAKVEISSSSEALVESSSCEKVVESSSSNGVVESSSSEYYKLSWDYLNPSIPYDTIIDSRDGQVYKIVTIGNQTWMAENLNYYDTIQLPDLKQHSWCLDDQILNCERYGRYYDNPIAMDYDSSQTSQYKRYKKEDGTYDSLNVVGICPNGWRVPTRSEWLSLDSSCDVRSAQWGGKNTCGVSVYSSGYRDTVSFFRDGAYFWTASYNSLVKPSTIVFEQKKTSGIFGMFRRKGLSIRCIKAN